MSVRHRMTSLLRTGAITMVEIAGELEVPVDTVKKTERRGRDRLFTRVLGDDGIYRIGLAAKAA